MCVSWLVRFDIGVTFKFKKRLKLYKYFLYQLLKFNQINIYKSSDYTIKRRELLIALNTSPSRIGQTNLNYIYALR